MSGHLGGAPDQQLRRALGNDRRHARARFCNPTKALVDRPYEIMEFERKGGLAWASACSEIRYRPSPEYYWRELFSVSSAKRGPDLSGVVANGDASNSPARFPIEIFV